MSPGEAVVTEAVAHSSVAASARAIWTNLDQATVAPAVRHPTYSGAFSSRSYDVSWAPAVRPTPVYAIEMKVLPNENSGGWQTVRGFIGAAFMASVDQQFAPGVQTTAVLIIPESEFQRQNSLQSLIPHGGIRQRLELEPIAATPGTKPFSTCIDRHLGIIRPTTTGMVGAMFAKFPSHAKSFVGMFNRPGKLVAEWDVSSVVSGHYRAIIYQHKSFSAQIQWPGPPNSPPTLEQWWP